MIFGALMVLTVHHGRRLVPAPADRRWRLLVALVVATIKGSLVALYFMHLLHERKVIYWVLSLTVIFFIFLMFVPLLTNLDKIPGTLQGTIW